MKKARFLLCVCLISLGLLLCACQTAKNVDDTNSTTPISESTQKAPKENTPATDKLTNAEWKTAYLDFIENNKNAYKSYALVYVDNDDVPELYMSGGCEAEGDRICSYKNGTIVDAYMNRIGGGEYIERGGSVINQNGHMGNCYTTVYKLDENGFTKTLSARVVEHLELVENKNPEDPTRPWKEEYISSYEYSIEGQPVSEEEYNAAIDAAFDFTNSLEFYDIAIPYEEIKQQITDWE